MFFGGGNPFGFGGAPPGYEDEDENEETLYSLLEVSDDASMEEIKQKYDSLKKKYGSGEEADPEKLESIEEAFEILSNPMQKKQYDAQIAQQKQIYQMMHGHAKGEDKGPKQKPKMQPMKKQIEVPLQTLYKGGNMPLFHQRARLCDVCEGKGGKDVTQCKDCKGQGAVLKMTQVAPGMYAQAEQDCQPCKGMGDIFGESGKCETCEGRKIVKKGVDLEIPIPPGIASGHAITIQNEGNEVASARAGDLIMIVAEQPNKNFTRKGADLFMKKTVTLVEALLGFHFELVHLDEKKYVIYTNPGDIIGDGSKKVLQGLGMPFEDEPQEKGNLIVEFKIAMPKRGELTPEQVKALTAALPGEVNVRPKDTNYEMMEDFDRENVNSNEEGGKKEDDFEEEQEGGIGCQAQ